MRFTADRMRLNPTESVKNRLTEHDVANHFEYNCRLQGSQGNSFVPVVAGGNHALSLHYVANDALINNGDMIMMDAGAVIS
jgi:intermediate cleaving peptidase 55